MTVQKNAEVMFLKTQEKHYTLGSTSSELYMCAYQKNYRAGSQEKG